MEDREEFYPFCCRCGSYNSLLLQKLQDNCSKKDICYTCGHPFVRCSITFDILPLIEFRLDSSLSDEEAIGFIQSPVKKGFSTYSRSELFYDCVTTSLEKQQCIEAYEPVKVDENTLKSLECREVLLIKPNVPGTRTRFFKNMLPGRGIIIDQNCCSFIREDIYELFCLKGEKCLHT